MTRPLPEKSTTGPRYVHELPCECESPHRRWYHGRDGNMHCEQCDGRPTLICPGCGATEDAGCVVEIGQAHFDRTVIGRQLLCVGHERPYWLQLKETKAV